jgi:hypothetical protein
MQEEEDNIFLEYNEDEEDYSNSNNFLMDPNQVDTKKFK